MKYEKIAVIGGDMRQKYLIDALCRCGFSVCSFGVSGECVGNCESLAHCLLGADAAVLPFPVSPDGVYLNAICEEFKIKLTELFEELNNQGVKTVVGGAFKKGCKELASRYGIELFDFGESESVKLKNALCTAEGTIEIAMRELPINLHASSCAVLGYGRIGSMLACRLRALGAYVTVFARKSEALALAECDGMKSRHISVLKEELPDFNVIFNTIPYPVLDKNVLTALNEDSLIIDLASAPGGVDFDEVKRLGIKAIWALSLPGKCSPKSAAEIICSAVNEYLGGGKK